MGHLPMATATGAAAVGVARAARAAREATTALLALLSGPPSSTNGPDPSICGLAPPPAAPAVLHLVLALLCLHNSTHY